MPDASAKDLFTDKPLIAKFFQPASGEAGFQRAEDLRPF
jgi:hypothetical protein